MKMILAVMLFSLVASSGFANEIEGTWKTKIGGPDGEMELTFVFKMEDGKLTGVVQSMNGDTPISNSKVDGKEFSFDVSFNDMVIKHQCTLNESDTITMKVSGTPMGDMELVLNRKV
jgi:hypothetical protein